MFEVKKGHILYDILVIKTKVTGQELSEKIHVPAFNEEEALRKVSIYHLNSPNFVNITVQIID